MVSMDYLVERIETIFQGFKDKNELFEQAVTVTCLAIQFETELTIKSNKGEIQWQATYNSFPERVATVAARILCMSFDKEADELKTFEKEMDYAKQILHQANDKYNDVTAGRYIESFSGILFKYLDEFPDCHQKRHN